MRSIQRLAPTLSRRQVLAFFLLGFGLTVLWFSVFGRVHFTLADEGFYWYGAQRVLLGEVPLRDFRSYDPGRYYWAAAVMAIVGDSGIYAARIAAALFQAVGVGVVVIFAMLALHKNLTTKIVYAVLLVFVLSLWMRPYYKVYDHVTAIAIVGAFAYAASTPKRGAWMLAGMAVGLAAFVGRNHGVYGVASALLLVTVLATTRRLMVHPASALLWLATGIAIGYAPMFVMLLVYDGMPSALWESIVFLFRIGSTNIPKAIPWPWNQDLHGLGFVTGSSLIFEGAAYIIFIGAVLLAPFGLYKHRSVPNDFRHSLYYSAMCVSFPYLHYTISRPDLTHLSLGVLPAFIALLVTPNAWVSSWRLKILVVLTSFTAIIFATTSPMLGYVTKGGYLEYRIANDKMYIQPGVANVLRPLNTALSERVVQPTFYAAPNMPGLYAIYGQKSPVLDTYVLFPASDQEQQSELANLQTYAPCLVFMSDHALDGREDLRLSRLRPMIAQWLNDDYVELAQLGGGEESVKIYGRQSSPSCASRP